MRDGTILTSESVTPGHPDKLCDRISDAAIDAFLRQDANARAIVECAVATGIVFIAARFAADAMLDLPSLARGVIAEAGYVGEGFDARTCSILTSVAALGEATHSGQQDDEAPAAEQANVFGYATDETPTLMPAPIVVAHALARALDAARGRLPWLGPDGKTQAGILYRGGAPAELATVALTVATLPGAPAPKVMEAALREAVVAPVLTTLPAGFASRLALHVNAGGPFAIGGPSRHAGLTGRKNGIDTYGEAARQSGAALSGKDPSRIDRVGAYAARHAAKCVIAAGLARRCEVHLGYMIGHARPLSVSVQCFGTARIDEDAIADRVEACFDFRPNAIARRFGLRQRAQAEGGFFSPLAVYGQMGREDLGVPWEDTADAAGLRDG